MNTNQIILVIDDSPDSLGMINEALSASGYSVLVALSAETAFTIMNTIRPDLILLDAIMPGMDGFETCTILKRTPGLSDIPIIFMTGLSQPEYIVKALTTGGVDYVQKPVIPSEVLARIRVHIGNAHKTQSAREALDHAGRHLLALDIHGRLLWATPKAASLLNHDMKEGESILPPEAESWVLACARRNTPAGARRSFDFPHAETTSLELTYMGQTRPGEYLLRLTAIQHKREEFILRERLSLTMREAEVLLWLGRGKTNRDIAEILSISPRTINKHLEQVYTKIGVENRASATAVVMNALQDS